MASRCLKEERSNSAGLMIQGTKQGAAGELALAVLATPGPPQLTILDHLEQDDKQDLGATCTGLRQASLVWFPEVTVEMEIGKTDVASLAAWLERHQASLHLLIVREDECKHEASEADWNDSLTALPSALVTSLTVYSLFGLPAAVSTLTALTRLDVIDAADKGNLRSGVSADRLQPLMRLRQLSLGSFDISGNAEELLSLPALARLQALQLSNCGLQAVPAALSALAQLTALDLSSNIVSATAPLAGLQRLRQLNIGFCDLAALPEQLAALTGLTHLTLTGNELTGGWLHLLPLTQLQYLEMSDCGLTAVSQPLSTLTALTRLDLAHNQLTGGWQHLLPLTQLQYLEMCNCVLSAVPRQLSALTALTRLDLRHSYELTGGWQHLLPLTQLQDLDLDFVRLPGAQPPPELAALPLLRILGTLEELGDSDDGTSSDDDVSINAYYDDDIPTSDNEHDDFTNDDDNDDEMECA